MSTLQVANIWFESTSNNRIQYVTPDSYAFVAGGTNTFVVNSTSIITNAAIVAGGSNGVAGQVLTSNGTGVFWSDVAGSGGTGTVTYIAAGNGINTSSGDPITGTGTLNVRAGVGLIANVTGVHVNAAYINTLTANNAMYLNGNLASNFMTTSGLAANVAKLDANNTSFVGGISASEVVNTSSLAANLSFYQTRAGLNANVTALGYINTAASYTITGVHTYNANLALTGTILLNGSNGQVGQVLTSNGNGNVYWSSLPAGAVPIGNTGVVSNAFGLFVNSAYIATLTVANTTNLNSQPGSYYTNATNISTGTLANARLGASVVNTSGAFTFTNVHTYNANVNLTGSLLLSGDTGYVGQVLTSNGTSGNTYWSTIADIQPITVALSDEISSITTGTAKVTFRAPYAMTLTSIPRASLSTASTSGMPTINIKVSGASILGTLLTIDANEKTSKTAATAATLTTTAIADDAEITFDVPVAGTGAKGLKVTLYARRTV